MKQEVRVRLPSDTLGTEGDPADFHGICQASRYPQRGAICQIGLRGHGEGDQDGSHYVQVGPQLLDVREARKEEGHAAAARSAAEEEEGSASR